MERGEEMDNQKKRFGKVSHTDSGGLSVNFGDAKDSPKNRRKQELIRSFTIEYWQDFREYFDEFSNNFDDKVGPFEILISVYMSIVTNFASGFDDEEAFRSFKNFVLDTMKQATADFENNIEIVVKHAREAENDKNTAH